MEYFIVKYPTSRGVILDENLSGNTNETEMAEEGHHEFKLEGESDYTPLSQVILVQNTDPDHPLEIVFTPAEKGGSNANG